MSMQDVNTEKTVLRKKRVPWCTFFLNYKKIMS